MKYIINTEKSEANFTAFAPMHKFAGNVGTSITGELTIDFTKGEKVELVSFYAQAETASFTTGDAERNKAMSDFFHFSEHPKASFTLPSPTPLQKKEEGRYSGTIEGQLEFAGIQRTVPLNCFLIKKKSGTIALGLSLKWSFKAFGVKAPRLLFLTVKDEVEINSSLSCKPEE